MQREHWVSQYKLTLAKPSQRFSSYNITKHSLSVTENNS